MTSDLLTRVVAGDTRAWHRFWSEAEATIWPVTGNPRVLGRLAGEIDERRAVVVAVMNRLRDSDFARLRAFVGRAGDRAPRALAAWLVVVTTRVAIDHLRAHERYRDRRLRDGVPRWIEVLPLDDDADGAAPPRLSTEDMVTARSALGFARSTLAGDQLAALEGWLEGRDVDELRATLALRDREAATRLVRSALKRLRDRYADDEVKT
ncbi:MAG: hypothetical protein JNL38_25070 [Myxococcales bacterium]|nr:hypothetical protein [Myxococcales bacterium]